VSICIAQRLVSIPKKRFQMTPESVDTQS